MDRIPPEPQAVHDALLVRERRYWCALALQCLGVRTEPAAVEAFLREFVSKKTLHVCRVYFAADDIRLVLKRSLQNFAIDEQRSQSRLKLRELPLDDESNLSLQQQIQIRLADLSPGSPEQSLLEREQTEAERVLIQSLLGELTPPLCEVIVEKYLLGRSSAEAARRLGISTTVFNQRVFRALAELRKVFAWTRRIGIAASDVRDWKAFSRRLVQDGTRGDRSVGNRIWTLGSDMMRLSASGLANGQPAEPALTTDLAGLLSDVLRRRDFYDGAYFHRCLPLGRHQREVRGLLKRHSRGEITSGYLNRLMFEDAYGHFLIERN